jgi:hypothetical protein
MAKHTDFASLQHLALGESYAIGEPYMYTSGETMEWITRNHLFPCLRTLSVCLDRDDQTYERPHYSEYAVSFFLAFKPLEELSINGPIDLQIMAAVLSHHGQTRKKLSLNPFEDIFHIENGRGRRQDIPLEFTNDLILQIKAQCPGLEELAIPVKRNKSRASEAETYRCFHEMKSLRFLFLTLDCSNWRVCRDTTYSPQFEGEDQRAVDPLGPRPIKRGNVKESFINCAVDEALARSIWKTISQNKRGRRIERLKLWTKGEDQYGWNRSISSVFRDVMDNLSRSWLIERGPRDDQEHITVRKLGQDARLVRNAFERELKRTLQPEAEEIFRDIWPRREGTKDWRDDWSSIPLEG